MDIDDIISDEIGGICGIAAPVTAYVIIFISILVHPGFSWANNDLSFLGAVDTSYNNIFNFGLMISSILGLIFTLAVVQFADSNLGYVGIGGFGAGLVCLLLLGIFPSGTPPHYALSILFFSLTLVGLIIFSIDQFLEMEYLWSVFILSSIVLSGILAGILYLTNLISGLAIIEFIGTIPIIQFSIVFGTRLYTE